VLRFRGYREKGFTLIEIAIVMIIIGILIGGGMPLLRALTEQKKRNETLSYMAEVKDSIISYAKIHGRLPLADGNMDGIEDRNCYSGLLPYITLNVKPVDSYSGHLKYEINEDLGQDKYTTCRALKNGLYGHPKVVDADATPEAFSVAAVIISSGRMDADNDGREFDKITKGSFRGDNTDGRPNYIRYPPVETFDDIVRYIGSYELYNAVCEYLSLAINNKTSKTVYVYNVNEGIDIGSLRGGESELYEILSGTRIEIRNMPDGRGHIVNSTPPTPIILSGTGLTIYIGSFSSSFQESQSSYKGGVRLKGRPLRKHRLR